MASDGTRLTNSCNLSLALKLAFTTSQNRACEQMLGEKKANICPVKNVNPPYPPPASLQLGTNPPPAPTARGWTQGAVGARPQPSAPPWILGQQSMRHSPRGPMLAPTLQTLSKQGLAGGPSSALPEGHLPGEGDKQLDRATPCVPVYHVCARDLLSCL